MLLLLFLSNRLRKQEKYYRKQPKNKKVVDGGFLKMENKPAGIRGEMDRRILDKMLIRKQISPEELRAYTDSLPDVFENADEIIVEITDETAEQRHDD